MPPLSTIERAFALASEGACRTIGDIRAQLKRENHDLIDGHLRGMGIQRELRARIAATR